jgi:hypothetical protein
VISKVRILPIALGGYQPEHGKCKGKRQWAGNQRPDIEDFEIERIQNLKSEIGNLILDEVNLHFPISDLRFWIVQFQNLRTTARPLLVMAPAPASSVIALKIPIMIAIRVVVMFKPAAVSIPVTLKERLPVMMRRDPTSCRVRWLSPITFVPLVSPSYGIPITFHPHERRGRPGWQNANHSRGWRWADSDSNRNLCAECRTADQ